VLVQPPVYYPFFQAVKSNGRRVVENPLVLRDGRYEVDFEGFEDAIVQNDVKLFILCSPHNPVGRVWTREELDTLAALAKRYGVQLIADEIHADLEMPGYKNTCILNADPDAIAFISATKTFNLAALRHSSVLIKNKELRDKFNEKMASTGINGINLFGRIAQTAAYQTGAEWLDALCEYLAGNRDLVEQFLRSELPQVSCARLQGTYLMWLDFSALNMEPKALMKFMVEKAGIGFNNGTDFGAEGAGFMRFNVATPRKNVVRALEQLKAAIAQL